MVTRKTTSAKRAHALKNGYRSGLEEDVCKQLDAAEVPYEYEKMKIKYIKPASEHQYTPDIVLDNGIIIETKGRFLIADRKKHMLIKRQQPHLDIRFVFSNSNHKLNKGSYTTYAQWCVKNGFMYADKTIPQDWLNERRRSLYNGSKLTQGT
jgi:hypothetical protein